MHMHRLRQWLGLALTTTLVSGPGWFAPAASGAGVPERAAAPDARAAERGRVALTVEGFLKPEWSGAVYRDVARLWGQPAPDPEKDPDAYATAFRHRYGLHPAPYANDGLPMGLRRG